MNKYNYADNLPTPPKSKWTVTEPKIEKENPTDEVLQVSLVTPDKTYSKGIFIPVKMQNHKFREEFTLHMSSCLLSKYNPKEYVPMSRVEFLVSPFYKKYARHN